MKRILLSTMLVMAAIFAKSQTTYYWVGGAAPVSIHTTSNWNTALNGAGSARVSATGATDILIFDGSNIGGAVPATGLVSGPVDGGITCAQMKFVNGANVKFGRTTGTGTITLNGDGTSVEDFIVESGCNFTISSATGSVRIAMAATNTGRVSGNMSMVTAFQARIDNTTGGFPGTLRFTSGSTFTTNITAASASYAFGNSTQSSERWVVFEAGSQLYYDGGFSPNGSGNLFSAIDMKPGSIWHQRATNPLTNIGNFFNRKFYGDVIVENNATLTAFGPIFQIGNLTVNSGCSFITHTSGQTAITGNLIVDGSFSGPASGTNELLFSGTTTQTVSGAGTITPNSVIVGDNASVVLNRNISADQAAIVNGRTNFNTNQLTGAGTFKAEGVITPLSGTATTVTGSYQLTGNAGIATNTRGQRISGIGIAANTVVVGFSSTSDTIYVSNPLTASGTGVGLSVTTSGAILETANTNGFTPATGSVALAGTQTFNDGVNYIINASTTVPFGVTTAGSPTSITAKFIEINAPVTVNRAFTVSDHLKVNGKITLRPLDIVHILSGGIINGTFNATNYIATISNSGNGDLSSVQYDGLASAVTLPIGSASNYLPVTLTPATSSNFTATAFEGITYNGTINGTPFLPSEKQNVVNAVWSINRLSGTGSSSIQFGWTSALEGSTFATLPNTDIGIITNNGTTWSLPIGTANNTTNIATATVSSFGPFGIGAVPQTQPFIFNALPTKTYGNADFNGGATSLNTSQPIIYTSSNPAVATIVAGNIHITGAGTATITASQASDGFYPPASITQPLTVNKAALTITADNKTKFQGQVNPALTITYTSFVLGETAAVLLTPVIITTTAVTASPAGNYPITVSGATSNNYAITFVNGTLTVQPQQSQTITFPAPAIKTYGNADFATGASSTNNTIPITFVSSNPGVATVIGNNIHIVGAGTTTITASQAGNAGYFPAVDVARTLTVNKAALAVKVRDTTKVTLQPNPAFTITYTGFVLGETVANLTTPPSVTTIANISSTPGVYALNIGGAVSNNYAITYTGGNLIVLPLTGTTATYMNAFLTSSNTLTVRVYSTEPKLGDIIIYDLQGRAFIRKNIFMPVGFISTDLFISTLPSGLYIVTIQGDGVDLKKQISIIR